MHCGPVTAAGGDDTGGLQLQLPASLLHAGRRRDEGQSLNSYTTRGLLLNTSIRDVSRRAH